MQIGHLNETQKRTFMLLDNRVAEDAQWDRTRPRGLLTHTSLRLERNRAQQVQAAAFP